VDKRFLTAFILPDFFEIEGFRLRPFCCKSLIALHAINSPMVKGGVPNEQDILNFLRICSLEFDGFFNLKKLHWWQQYFYFKMKYWPPFKIRVLMFIKVYMEESMASPLVRIKNKNGVSEKTITDNESLPDVLMMITVLMSKLGMSEKEALELPIGRALCYSLAYTSIEGVDVALIPDDSENAEDIKREMAEHEKSMKKRMRLAMDNGKIPRRTIKTTNT
jgi:hypothetical protein